MVAPAIRARLLLIALVLVATMPLLAGRFPAIGDMRDVYLPIEHFFQTTTQSGHLPAWQPLAAWGFPVIASGQIGYFYPPLFLLRLLLPVFIYLPATIILHFIALTLGTYVLARQYQQSRPAAILASTAFTYSAFVWQHLIHLNIFLTLAFLPWQLWYTHRLRTVSKLQLHHIACLALLLGTPFLIGQFQIPALLAAVSTIHLFYVRWRHRQTNLKTTLLSVFLAAIISLGLAAAQILPTAELTPHSSRGDSSQQFDISRANQYSYPLYHIPTILFPRFYDSYDHYWGKRLEIEYGFFLGTIPLLLTMYWLWRRPQPFRPSDQFWLALTGISFLLALGSLSPFRLIGLEPSLWIFSAPARWLLFTSFGISLLAGRALDTVSFSDRSWKRFLVILGILILITIAIGNFLLFSSRTIPIASQLLQYLQLDTPYNQQKIAAILASARQSSVSVHAPYTYLPPLIIATLLLFTTNQQFSAKKPLIIGLTAAELLLINAAALPTRPWSHITQTPDTVNHLPESVPQQQARLYSIRPSFDSGAYFTNPQSRTGITTPNALPNLLIPIIHTQHGLPGVEWPASLNFANQEPVLTSLRQPNSYQISNPANLEKLNIGAVTAPANMSLPRLEQASSVQSTTDQVTIYHLNPAPRFQLQSLTGHPIGRITSQQTSPTGNLHFTIQTNQPAQLIMRDTYYPGWQATVNNQPVSIQPHPPFFRRLTLPAGQHSVHITYHPQTLYLGITLTIITAILCCTVILQSRHRPIFSSPKKDGTLPV